MPNMYGQLAGGQPPQQDTNDPNHPDVQKLWAQYGPQITQLMQQNPKALLAMMQQHGVDPATIQQLMAMGQGGARGAA